MSIKFRMWLSASVVSLWLSACSSLPPTDDVTNSVKANVRWLVSQPKASNQTAIIERGPNWEEIIIISNIDETWLNWQSVIPNPSLKPPQWHTIEWFDWVKTR